MPLPITLSDEIAPALGGTAAERQPSARESIALELYREGNINFRRLRQTSISLTDDLYAAALDRDSRRHPT